MVVNSEVKKSIGFIVVCGSIDEVGLKDFGFKVVGLKVVGPTVVGSKVFGSNVFDSKVAVGLVSTNSISSDKSSSSISEKSLSPEPFCSSTISSVFDGLVDNSVFEVSIVVGFTGFNGISLESSFSWFIKTVTSGKDAFSEAIFAISVVFGVLKCGGGGGGGGGAMYGLNLFVSIFRLISVVKLVDLVLISVLESSIFIISAGFVVTSVIFTVTVVKLYLPPVAGVLAGSSRSGTIKSGMTVVSMSLLSVVPLAAIVPTIKHNCL